MNNIPIYKFALRPDLIEDKRFLPTRAELRASGWDVRAAMPDKQPLIIKPFDLVKIPLGVRGFCPEGWWYEIKPRSSSFVKKNLHALYGTIDETYEGELIFACQYIPPADYYNYVFPSISYTARSLQGVREWNTYCLNNTIQIDFGDAVGQIIPIRREEMIVNEITNEDYDNACLTRATPRGSGGFGSTGK